MEPIKDVTLHVYELQTTDQQQQQQQQSAGMRALSFFSKILPGMGYGAYHTSLEVMNDRYTFAANAGIVKSRSRTEHVPGDANYKESILLGACSVKNRGELQEILTKLSNEFFTKTAYHLVHRNCNHFTETLATAIILKDTLSEPGGADVHKLKYYPPWINRLANTSKMVISHDDDIKPCSVLEEARAAVGADTKVGWDFGGSGKSSSSSSNNKKRSSSQKKELTEKQKAALAKIRGNK